MLLVPRPVVTVTSTVFSVPAGAVAAIDVSLCTEKLVAGVAPNFPADTPGKFAPLRDSPVPPVLGPDAGLTAVTTGSVNGGPAVMDTFWTWWMSLNPPVAAVNPTST